MGYGIINTSSFMAEPYYAINRDAFSDTIERLNNPRTTEDWQQALMNPQSPAYKLLAYLTLIEGIEECKAEEFLKAWVTQQQREDAAERQEILTEQIRDSITAEKRIAAAMRQGTEGQINKQVDDLPKEKDKLGHKLNMLEIEIRGLSTEKRNLEIELDSFRQSQTAIENDWQMHQNNITDAFITQNNDQLRQLFEVNDLSEKNKATVKQAVAIDTAKILRVNPGFVQQTDRPAAKAHLNNFGNVMRELKLARFVKEVKEKTEDTVELCLKDIRDPIVKGMRLTLDEKNQHKQDSLLEKAFEAAENCLLKKKEIAACEQALEIKEKVLEQGKALMKNLMPTKTPPGGAAE